MIEDAEDCCFRILGPVEVIAEAGPLRFARRQQLDLVAFLLLHSDQIVTIDQIVDAMWGGAAPPSANTQIKNMISGLRRSLRDGERPLAAVVRKPGGYRLDLCGGVLDLNVFNQHVNAARRASTPATAVEMLRRALALWRGTLPLAGVRAPYGDGARAHLSEQRESTLEILFDAELDRGNHAEIVAALTDAVTANPGRQRFVHQLMLALHRGGRTTDALAVYRTARRTLVDEYGLEPAQALKDLERRILAADPALDHSADAPVAASPSAARPHRAPAPVPAQLPLDVRGFAGRDLELASLNGLLDSADGASAPIVSLLMGTAGVGKTALAVHWAHQIAHRFPDGQLYINLRGFHPRMAPMVPHEAISGFLNALGLAPEQTPEGVDARAGLYRSLVAGRRVLIVLDDAASTEQVRPLLPGTPGCYVIVTSRNRLTGLVAVEAAHPLTLDVLSGTEARELLVHRLGRARVAAEAGAVEAITSQCARLPLALAIVAAHAAIHPNFALSTVSAELSAHRNGVRPLGGSGAETDVRTTFSWSYERLSPAAARLFRLIGLLPGADFGLAAASSLDGRPAGATRSALAELAEAHLITERVPGRFTMHDLLRAYANELAEIIDDGEARHLALRRAVDHYLRSAYRASTLIYPHRYPIALTASAPGVEVIELGDGSAALLWFAEEHPVLLAVLERAASEGLVAHTWQLASALSTFLDRRGHWHDWVSTQHRALASAERGGDLRGQAHAHGSLGLAYNRLKRYDEAHDHLDRGYQLFCELGDVLGQAYIHLRMSLVADGQADMGAALNHAEQALELYRAAGHRIGQGQALNSIGWYRAQMGDFAAAVSRCEQAVSLHRELGDREGVANALDSLGFAHHNLGQFATAIACYQEALDALRGRGDPYYETITLTHMGDTYEAAGDTEAARGVWVESLTILDGLGHPDAHPVRVRLKHLDG